MNHELVPMPFDQMRRLADAIAKSRLFGIATPDQALVLMAISQAEGRHPALAARDYDIIAGRPAKKAEAMMRDFLAAGGKVEWHVMDDAEVDATFSHQQGGTVRIKWDMARAKMAGLEGKENYRKYPRAMLRSRVVSEGVRAIWPMATSGFYVPEEVSDFRAEPRDITPANTPADLDAFAAETPKLDPIFLALAESVADKGIDAFRDWWKVLSKSNRDLLRDHLGSLQERADKADQASQDPPQPEPEPDAEPDDGLRPMFAVERVMAGRSLDTKATADALVAMVESHVRTQAHCNEFHRVNRDVMGQLKIANPEEHFRVLEAIAEDRE